MSGICGSTNDSRSDVVARMNAAMAASGSDEERVYTDFLSGFSLGARPRRLIDVKGGRQPVTNEDGTVWAVLSGEVYNQPALQETLCASGHRLATGVDTELLVHLYEEHRAAMVHALEGMYAFAVWDARRQALLLVRDRFPGNPLFYAHQAGDLLFASELDALLAGVNQEPELDPGSIEAAFVFGYVPGPASIVRGVNQLPPGHLLRWDRRSRRVQVKRYWTAVTAAGPSSGDADNAWVAETGRQLERSVRSRLRADGLDSTLRAALATRMSDKLLQTLHSWLRDESARRLPLELVNCKLGVDGSTARGVAT
jgi:asparagine synthase (glutamine-hydrolysing)